MHVLKMRACFSQPPELMSPLHFDDHPHLPKPKKVLKLYCNNIKCGNPYNVYLGRMKKAIEHCGILLKRSLPISLPLCHAFWKIFQLMYCDTLMTLTF